MFEPQESEADKLKTPEAKSDFPDFPTQLLPRAEDDATLSILANEQSLLELQQLIPDKNTQVIRKMSLTDLVRHGVVFVNVVGGGEKRIFSDKLKVEGTEVDLSQRFFLSSIELAALQQQQQQQLLASEGVNQLAIRLSCSAQEAVNFALEDMKKYLRGYLAFILLGESLRIKLDEAGYFTWLSFPLRDSEALLTLVDHYRYRESSVTALGFTGIRGGRVENQNPFLQDPFVLSTNIDVHLGQTEHSPRLSCMTLLLALHGLSELGSGVGQNYISIESYINILLRQENLQSQTVLTDEAVRKLTAILEAFETILRDESLLNFDYASSNTVISKSSESAAPNELIAKIHQAVSEKDESKYNSILEEVVISEIMPHQQQQVITKVNNLFFSTIDALSSEEGKAFLLTQFKNNITSNLRRLVDSDDAFFLESSSVGTANNRLEVARHLLEVFEDCCSRELESLDKTEAVAPWRVNEVKTENSRLRTYFSEKIQLYIQTYCSRGNERI